MELIINDEQQLKDPAEPLEFLSETGIVKEEGLEVIAKLKEVMQNDQTVISLSAPQIGIKKRIFCIRFNDNIKVFINPVITKKTGCIVGPETFLALPGKEILIGRPEEITIIYYNEDFKYEDNKLLGPAARIFDQQAQLLDGILPSDLGLVSDIAEDGSLFDLTNEEMTELVEVYKQFISAKTKALQEDINKDDEESKLYNKLKFTESVINGRSQIIADEYKEPAIHGVIKNNMKKQANQANLKNFLRSKK